MHKEVNIIKKYKPLTACTNAEYASKNKIMKKKYSQCKEKNTFLKKYNVFKLMI